MAEVGLSSGLRDAAGGTASVNIEAATIRELLRKLVERYPKMQTAVAEGLSVSINGQIFRDDHTQAIPDGAEVYLLPRIPGG